ncbi:hypothetical protein NXV03_08160 [Phocaeicola vulgatus]|nr:hypothetical protein [Phocaeicola vulgatus]
MKKIIAFFKMSNRYKHLIGGLMVGLLGFTPWTAFYVLRPLQLPVWN